MGVIEHFLNVERGRGGVGGKNYNAVSLLYLSFVLLLSVHVMHSFSPFIETLHMQMILIHRKLRCMISK